MTLDLTQDNAINDFLQLCTLQVPTISYNNRGEPTKSWGTSTTANVDIQPTTQKNAITTEVGLKIVYPYVIYGYYNISGVALAVNIGDRWVDASGLIYEVKFIKYWSQSHFEYYCNNVKGQL